MKTLKTGPEMLPRQTPPSRPRRWPAWLMGGIALAGSFAAGWHLKPANHPKIGPYSDRVLSTRSLAKLPRGKPVQAGGNPVGWDLQGQLAAAARLPKGREQLAALLKLVDDVPVPGLAALLAQAAVCPDAEVRDWVTSLAYEKWVRAEAAGALAHAYAQAIRAASPDYLRKLFTTWSGFEPRAALRAALALDRASYRALAVTQTLTIWAQSRDSSGALAAARSLPPGTTSEDPVRTVVAAWAYSDPLGAWAALEQVLNAKTRAGLQMDILAQLATSDPRQAFALLQQLPPGQDALQAYGKVLRAWARLDPSSALAAVQDMPLGEARAAAAKAAFSGWAEAYPTAALLAAKEFSPSSLRDSLIDTVFPRVALQDPATAAEYVGTVQAGAARDRLILTLARQWAESDPQSAWLWLQQNSAGKTLAEAGELVLKAISANDPQAALVLAAQVKENSLRETYQRAILNNWARLDAGAAVAWALAHLSGSTQDRAVETVLGVLAELDPMTAATYSLETKIGLKNEKLVNKIGQALAAQDPRTALEWIRTLPANTSFASKSDTIVKAVAVMVSANVAEAGEFFRPYVNERDFSNGLFSLIGSWSQLDNAAALAWAETLPDPARGEATGLVLKDLAKTDGREAFAYAVQFPNDPGVVATMSSIVSTWSEKDPVAASQALKAANDLPEAVWADLQWELIGGWVKSDLPGASAWVVGLPPGKARDTASRRLIHALAPQDPEAAFNLALSASTNSVRNGQLVLVVTAWAKKDPVAATAALTTVPFTDDERASFQELIGTIARGVPQYGPLDDPNPSNPDLIRRQRENSLK